MKKNNVKKAVSIVVALILVCSVFPISVLAGSNITINGVDIGYAVGDYWRDTNDTYQLYGASQCMAFARYCEQAVYGVNDYKNSSEFTDITGTKSASSCTGDNLKTWLMNCAPATHLRFPGGTRGAHSVSIAFTTDWGVHIVHANWPSDNLIGEDDWSWDTLAGQAQQRGGIAYARSCNRATPVDPPSDPVVHAEKKVYATGDSIKFIWDATGANSIHLYVIKDGQQWFNGEYPATGSVLKECYSSGHYAFYIVAHYNGRDIESAWDDCDVYDRSTLVPNAPDLWLSAQSAATGESIDIHHWSEKAQFYVVRIYKDNTLFSEETVWTSTTTKSFSQTGNYSVAVTAGNEFGQSAEATAAFCINANPSDIPIAPDLWLSSSIAALGEEITIYHWSEKAQQYRIAVYRDNTLVSNEVVFTGSTVKSYYQKGSYTVVAYAENSYGTSAASSTGFTVYDSVPAIPAVSISPASPVLNSQATIILTPSACSTDAFMTIRNLNTGETPVGPGLQVGVYCLSFEYIFTKIGRYSIEYATANSYGSSPVVSMVVEITCPHVWDSGVITTNPTCTVNGVKTYTCSICNGIYLQTIPAPGHSWNNGEVTTQPTYTTEGEMTYTCTVCGAERIEPIPMLESEEPVIVSQPVNAEVIEGDRAYFHVVATGADLTYQWQFSTNKGKTWYNSTGQGATTADLNVAGSAANTKYLYRCMITNAAGSAISGSVRVILIVVPVIETQPVNAEVVEGERAYFHVVASGTDFTYQWQYSSNNGKTWKNSTAATANTPDLNIAGSAANAKLLYRCVITNAAGSAATVTVRVVLSAAPPVIVTQPVNAEVIEGERAYFHVAASGTDLAYQWQFSSNNGRSWYNSTGQGAATADLNVAGSAANTKYLYRCVITNAAGSVTTDVVRVVLIAAPEIVTQPVNAVVTEGSRAYFHVVAAGDNLTYQWQFSSNNGRSWYNSNGQGAKTADLNVAGSAANTKYLYRCVITNAAGSVTTESVRVVLTLAPVIVTEPTDTVVTEGERAYFSVAATGENLTYQWQYSKDNGKTWKNSTGQGAATADLNVAGSANNAKLLYRCVITNAHGAATTKSVRLTLG